MATQNGTDILLLSNGQRFAALTTNEFNLTSALRDTTSKDSGGWKTQDYGLREASVSATGLMLIDVKNLLSHSEDFSNAVWTKTGLTVNAAKVAGPQGLINANAFSGATSGDFIEQQLPLLDLSAQVNNGITFSVWLRGSCSLRISTGDDSSSEETSEFTLTSTWTRYNISYTLLTGTGLYVLFAITSSGSLEAYGAQLELSDAPTSYQPSGLQWDYFLNCLEQKTAIPVEITDQTQVRYTATALLSNVQLSAPMEENATITADMAITNIVTKTNI